MFYITPSLHNAVYWYLKLDKPIDELMNCLNKVRIEPNEAMLKGIKFENDIVAFQSGAYQITGNITYDEQVSTFADEIGNDAIWQEPVSCELHTSYGPVMAYGKIDAVNRNKIWDVKYSKSYDVGKFSDSIQHLIYMNGARIENFTYRIATPSGDYSEDYYWSEQESDRLQSEVEGLMRFIMTTNGVKEAFIKNWKWKEEKNYAIPTKN